MSMVISHDGVKGLWDGLHPWRKQPNVPDQRPRATDSWDANEPPSRGSLHPVCSAIHSSSLNIRRSISLPIRGECAALLLRAPIHQEETEETENDSVGPRRSSHACATFRLSDASGPDSIAFLVASSRTAWSGLRPFRSVKPYSSASSRAV